MTGDPLDRELALFRANRPGWLAAGHEGEWVAILGDSVSGPHGDYEAALSAGYERFGPVPFLVKEVEEVERVHNL